MPTHPIFGHSALRSQLGQALDQRRLPQVLLMVGEPGVGKQRLALWLAQKALCTTPDAGAEPCGACRACRLVLDLAHPDVYWFVPIPRPKASEPDRQVDEAAEALAEIMAARREHPRYSRPDGMAMHGVASARLLLRLTTLTTVEGGRRVIVIGDADRLVPQESSPEAANALLKLLEEPPADTLLVLTATDPTRVLPTIRSRAVVVRVGRLADAELEQGLAALLPELSPGARRERIQRAAGSLGRALDDSGTEAIDSQVIELLEAAKRGGVARFERALSQGPWAARGDFTALLDRLAEALGQAARARATGGDSGVPDVLATVNEPTRVLRALDRVAEAREAAQRNVNPQLLLATLTGDLAEALWA